MILAQNYNNPAVRRDLENVKNGEKGPDSLKKIIENVLSGKIWKSHVESGESLQNCSD